MKERKKNEIEIEVRKNSWWINIKWNEGNEEHSMEQKKEKKMKEIKKINYEGNK